ncbi:Cortactin-binding protein 2, partial [Dissostichus eleginoides]
AQRKEVFLQERYGHYSLTDPFLALQRDFESGVPGGDAERRPLGSSPISVLEAVMAHCRKMQERILAPRSPLEMEKLQLQSLEQDHRKLTAQLKDEREKNKHIVMMLVRECKQLATRVVEESQRFDELQARLDEESRASGRLQEELSTERQHSQQMEAKMEKQLSEFDTEREQLRARLGREETESQSLRQQVEQLRTEPGDGKDAEVAVEPAAEPAVEPAVEPKAAAEPTPPTPPIPKAVTSVSVATEPISSRTASSQTDNLPPTEVDGPIAKKSPLTVPAKPTPANYVGLSLPKTSGRGLVHSSSGGLVQTENGSEGNPPTAARYKFQEQDQNGTSSQSPPARDLSPTNRDNFAAKQQARHTVTQVLSRFTSPPAGGPMRPGLPHSASEGGPFPGRLSHPIGLKSPTVARIDRGNPPPIPPKKPGLSQTPSPPHPSMKGGVGDRSSGGKPATPQLPPKPAPGPGPSPDGLSGGCLLLPGGRPDPCMCRVPPRHQLRLHSPEPQQAAPWQQHQMHDNSSTSCTLPVSASINSSHLRLMSSPPSAAEALLPWTAGAPSSPKLLPREIMDTQCVKLLLSAGSPADVSEENGFTPLHFAAAHGHSSWTADGVSSLVSGQALLSAGAAVDVSASGGQTSLFLACETGSLESVRVLLSAGAERSLCTADGCSSLHAAVRSGNVDTLRLLLCYRTQGDPPTVTSDPPLALPEALLNRDNSDGWTAAHMAAALGLKECLEVLCSHSEQDIERRDKCNRTIHDVATDDCKDLLENLHSYRVLVLLQCSGGGGLSSMCPVEALEEEAQQGVHPLVLGRLAVHRDTLWSHSSSIASFIIGDTEWLPDQELPLSPWDLVRKPLSQSVTIRLKGLSESCLHESALESLFPLPLLHNYVEQYGNLIFQGLEGSCLEFIANLVARCIKSKQDVGGLGCFLVPAGGSGSRCVLVLLEGLERASSLSGLMGDLCLSLDSRGSAAPLHLSTGPHHFSESSFLIGTLSRPRLQGPELRLQQHFRWVTLRWDQEPLQGMLGRHLRRKLIHKTGSCLSSPSSPLQSSVLWVRDVWQQLNACLSRLGTPEALIGPQLFLSCPVLPGNTQAVIRWLSRLWNAVVVPRVEEAVIARVTARRPSTTTSTSSTSSQRPSLSNTGLSAGQQAVVKAALSILVNKAVLQGCHLPRHEIDSGKLRRSNTSPRKKGGTPNWSSGGSFREGSLSSTDVSFIPNGKVQRSAALCG